ncbi:DedA family protein [Brevibacillus sp. B_LB10_24]|uniref:DedA family protein n=1 Tax=Brevibacillus sp. B_LB10_24 TaxID=3380645 RepID=UPI0038B9EC5B
MATIVHWFETYGLWVLFFGLLLEYVALPFPGEFVLTYAGFLSYSHHFSWLWSVLLAAAGTTLGISITYLIGRRVGRMFFEKVGTYFFLGPDKLDKASRWFDTYGNKVLFIAFFIPGLRHVTGYLSGILKLPFRTFAVYAYSGAVFWVLTFFGAGYLLGPNWQGVHRVTSSPWVQAGMIIAAACVAAVFVYKYRRQLGGWPATVLRRLYERCGRVQVGWVVKMTAVLLLITAVTLLSRYVQTK